MPSETLFPHLTATSPAPSYREVVSTYRNVLATRFAEGRLRPFVLPYHLYGKFLLIIYLCIPHKLYPLVYQARWLVLGVILWFEWKTTWETCSQSMATALACGLVSAWDAVWSVTWLVLRSPQWDAKRVQRKGRVNWSWFGGKKQSQGSKETQTSARSHGNTQILGGIQQQTGSEGKPEVNVDELRQRTQVNGHSQTVKHNGYTESNGGAKEAKIVTSDYIEGDDENTEYFWQSYPENISQRVYWVMDLSMNFRGPGWNWAIPPLPDLPRSIKLRLGNNERGYSKRSSVGLESYKSRRELFNARIPRFIFGYLILDLVKVIMMKDPYFIFGPNTYALPPHLASLSPLQLRIYREILGAITIITSLQMTFALGPLYMSLLYGPKVFGQRAEAWYFPTTWGSFSNITNKGLNGLWGGWWHQTFRFAFTAPSNYLITHGYIKARSLSAKLSALFFAFGISAFLHTGASISQLPKTHPWAATGFFMLQVLGIVIQTIFSSILTSQINNLPKFMRQAGNVIFTTVWLMSTGWILLDDFSRGGVWLFEPIPISPLRGLGFGVEGDGWWCWEHVGVGWYKGRHWWESGIAL